MRLFLFTAIATMLLPFVPAWSQTTVPQPRDSTVMPEQLRSGAGGPPDGIVRRPDDSPSLQAPAEPGIMVPSPVPNPGTTPVIPPPGSPRDPAPIDRR